MAEKKVPYQVNGRQFEGVIVYDDSVKTKRPVIFDQPDWKGVCADTIEQAHTLAGKDYVVLLADMFGAGYGDKPKTREELRAGMTAVHKDLPFTIACGNAAYDVALAEADKLGLIDPNKKRGGRLLRGRRLCSGAGARRRGFQGDRRIPRHQSQPGRSRHAVQHQGPGAGDPWLGRSGDAEADDGRARGRTHQGQSRLAHRDVRRRRAFVLRSDRQRSAGAQYDEKLCRTSYMLTRDFFAETL